MHAAQKLLAAAACCTALCSCHQLHLVEQLDAKDKRVPIVNLNEQAIKNTPCIYEHKGNYYSCLHVAYAKRNVDSVTDSSLIRQKNHQSGVWSYSDISALEAYYFPLTDDEVDSIQGLPRGTTKQPISADKLTVVKVTNAPKMRKLPVKYSGMYALRKPKSANILAQSSDGEYQTGAIPIIPGKRTITQKLLLGPAYVADYAGNAVIIVTEAPLCLVGSITIAPFMFLLEPLITPFIVI